jgi:transposase-like protein
MSPAVAAFRPPHCPNPACDFHRDARSWKFRKKGFFHRRLSPQLVQRYRCSHCGRSFSTQTFSPSYWLKRPDVLVALFHPLVACAGHRQIARGLGVSPTTVTHQVLRLGRHCQLLHEALRPREPIAEPLVVDGFRSFEHSQYHPNDFHVAVGARTHFFYGFTVSELRRGGSMRPGQRRHRVRLERRFGRPDPRATEKDLAALLSILAPSEGELVVHSDDHRAYPRAFQRLSGVSVSHAVTSARRIRTPRNPLFPVNLLDGLIRHSSANHKRETIAFSKRRQAAAARLWVFLVWRNYVKSWSERRRDPPPGQRIGCIARRLTPDEILRRRLFPSRIPLPRVWRQQYEGRVVTRAIPNNRFHELRYAS